MISSNGDYLSESASTTYHSDRAMNLSVEPLVKENNKRKPIDEFDDVLSTDLAQAVIEHRKLLKSPLTQHAALLLANQLKKCADPELAVNTMIERGWKSINQGWLDNAGIKSSKPCEKPKVFVPKELPDGSINPAWEAHQAIKKTPVSNGGWYFPTEYPPGEPQ